MSVSAPLASFAAGYPFELDDFQVSAIEALARGESVLVAAPTGSGKTIVGEFAVWMALREGGKTFYTTPLKALSNQKLGDFIALHGAENVGLLTGDNSINPSASVVVMTTEVLRNMIYERSELLEELMYVVLDEVHYLQDPYRGAVWEEVIIHLPVDVKIVSLSATVSNVDEFADWLRTVRGVTAAIVEKNRPVDLEQHYLIDRKLMPMFTSTDGDRTLNPQILRLESGFEDLRRRTKRQEHRRGRRRVRRFPPRPEVVEKLAAEDLTPAIYFIFSRKGCDAAVARCLAEGIRLTSSAERSRIREYAEMRCSYLPDADLDILGYDRWLEALTHGVAAHHAGLIPVFKETVEELFQTGLVKVVFATETLSLGINMPARTVVIESMMKFSGERHELLTPAEYTQLTGRAGRRGIDTLGHSVVIDQQDVPFRQVASVASTSTFPLLSSFQPSYNMATNLVRNYSRDESEHLLNSSFAQFRGDRDVVVAEGRIEKNEAYLASYREKMACHRGDFWEYWKLRDRVGRLERSLARWESTRKRDQTRQVLSLARPGQVYVVSGGRSRGPVVVVGAERSKRGEPRVVALTPERRLVRLTTSDFEQPPRPVGNLSGGRGFAPGGRLDNETRRRLASQLAELELPEVDPELDSEDAPTDLSAARREMGSHPSHTCPDFKKHAQWAERAIRLERDTARLRKQVKSRTETISVMFEKILSILEKYKFVDGFSLTDKGTSLAHIYNESDLVVAESLSRGWFSDLPAPELASVVSTFVFESRGPSDVKGSMPTAVTKKLFGRITRLTEEIRVAEHSAGLELTRGVEQGFGEIIYEWCRGAELEDVLDESTPGDFIRSCKQTIDLLRQLRDAAGESKVVESLDEAITGINRGVVAYTGVV
jgi:ATP-dependent RNA helicase HelY